MQGPAGPFTPWVEHPIEHGRCPACGLTPPARALTAGAAVRAYTHAGCYLTCRPTGRIILCAKETA